MLALACSGCIRAFVRFAGRFLANKSHPARRATLKPSARKSTNASRPRRRGRTRFAVLHTHDLAAVVWPHTCRIPTPSNGKHEESRIVNPMIPDLAAAAQRLSAAQRTHLRIARSDRTSSPDRACAARREWPSQFHRNGASLLATDATNPRAWRRGSTHPDRCMRGQK